MDGPGAFLHCGALAVDGGSPAPVLAPAGGCESETVCATMFDDAATQTADDDQQLHHGAQPCELQTVRCAKEATSTQCAGPGWAEEAGEEALEAAEEQARQAAATVQAAQQEVHRRLQPRSREDFNLLLDELAMWWGEEQAKIAGAPMTEEEQQTARCMLLVRETKLLQTIDRLRVAAAPIVRAERIARELAAMSAPKQWKMADGRVLEVMTPTTLRNRELAAAYSALVATDGLNLDARLNALLAVKKHAKAVSCSLAREVLLLVDREADLLNRGREAATMAGLRARLATTFLQLIKQCEGESGGW